LKHIRVTFSNGETYEIPATNIANNKGKHFADKEFGEQERGEAPDPRWTNVYRKERNTALENSEELIDWAENNTNWEDLEQFAKLIPTENADLNKHDEWATNDKTIVEHN